MVNMREKGRFQGMEDLEWEGNRYKTVAEFRHLGAPVSKDNKVSAEIRAQTASENRCVYAFIRLLKASTLPRKLKLTVYRVIIRRAVLYRCEMGTLTECDKNRL
jgi:hypothetical protein